MAEEGVAGGSGGEGGWRRGSKVEGREDEEGGGGRGAEPEGRGTPRALTT